MNKPDQNYHPQLDGLRAICIMFTLFNHVQGVPRWINGTVGVDVFFALSGFLITTLLATERRETASISLKAFYIRRIFRIVPLYLLAYAATVASAFLLYFVLRDGDRIGYIADSFLWVITFNRELCPAVTCGPTFFGHVWTIGIEEKFYILWPIVFAFMAPRSVTLLIACLAGTVVSMSMAWHIDFVRGYGGLAFGCMAAIWLQVNKRTGRTAAWLAAALAVVAAGYYTSTALHEAGNLLVSLGSAALIMAMVQQPQSVVSRTLAMRWLVWLGKLTYGLYLFHVLAINVVKIAIQKLHLEQHWLMVTLLSYALSIVVAYALYRTVEKPMIAIGRRLAAAAKARQGARSAAGIAREPTNLA